jgi:hypothetical protein
MQCLALEAKQNLKNEDFAWMNWRTLQEIQRESYEKTLGRKVVRAFLL